MKASIILLLIPAACGCTSTEFSTPNWTLKRTSFLQRIEVPEVQITTNGVAVLRGYKNDGGNEALATAVAAAVSAAIQAMKP